MSTSPTESRLSALEQALLDLARSQGRTQENLERTQENLDLLTRESRQFQQEMRVFKDEMRAASERSDRRWGELANKMGTLVEDIVAPGIPQVFRTMFAVDVVPEFAIRVRRRHTKQAGRMQEFDVVVSGGGFFLINETKSQVTPEDIPRFLSLLSEVRGFFPDAEGTRVVGALASFAVDPSLVTSGERQGLLMLGLSRGLLEVLNTPGFKPREF